MPSMSAPTSCLEAAAGPRVIVHEQTNARNLTRNRSRASRHRRLRRQLHRLTKVLPARSGLHKPERRLVALVKPQFEAGREEVGKGGVVRDEAVHRRVCDEAAAWAFAGMARSRRDESPITGPEGNREFLLGAIKE
jgi:23S rRNA (cytidine1920-2'-O)/16S rRNA (cytidine1409-2'-O)-methyltransferase